MLDYGVLENVRMATTRMQMCVVIGFSGFDDAPREIRTVWETYPGARVREASFQISLRLLIKTHRKEHLQTPVFALWASDLGFRKLIGPSCACVFRRVYKCVRLGRCPGSKKTTLSDIALFPYVGRTLGDFY